MLEEKGTVAFALLCFALLCFQVLKQVLISQQCLALCILSMFRVFARATTTYGK